MTNDTRSIEVDVVEVAYGLINGTKKIEDLIHILVEWGKAIRDLSYQEGYDEGYDNGRNEGYDEGYEEGEKEGHDEGYNEAMRIAEERIHTYGCGLDHTEKFRLGRIIRGQF